MTGVSAGGRWEARRPVAKSRSYIFWLSKPKCCSTQPNIANNFIPFTNTKTNTFRFLPFLDTFSVSRKFWPQYFLLFLDTFGPSDSHEVPTGSPLTLTVNLTTSLAICCFNQLDSVFLKWIFVCKFLQTHNFCSQKILHLKLIWTIEY